LREDGILKKYGWLILLLPLLMFFIAQNISAQGTSIVLVEHKLCKEIKNGRPDDVTKNFTTDDRVFSWLAITGTSKGDEIAWTYQGPKGQEIQKSLALAQGGDQTTYMELDLNQYSNAEVTGNWTVTILFNGEKAVTDAFTVEPLTGLVWWGPIAGFLLLLGAIITVIIVVLVTILLVIRSRKAKQTT
jgi:hypothetical protein